MSDEVYYKKTSNNWKKCLFISLGTQPAACMQVVYYCKSSEDTLEWVSLEHHVFLFVLSLHAQKVWIKHAITFFDQLNNIKVRLFHWPFITRYQYNEFLFCSYKRRRKFNEDTVGYIACPHWFLLRVLRRRFF